MKRAVLAISVLSLMVMSAWQTGLVVSADAGKQQLTEFKIAQAAAKPTKKPTEKTESAADATSATAAATVHGSAANGGECIRETSFMRKNHMDLILHKRNETMRKGIRTKDASLKECVSCHAVKGDDGDFVKVTDPKHFCRGCHDYVAVKIDCFECHASRPEMKKESASLNPHKRLSPFALRQSHKASATALNSFLGAQTDGK